jgi:hypothetical protein
LRAFATASVFLVVLVAASSARAEPAPVLRLESPDGAIDPSCLALGDLAAGVARTLGRPALQTVATGGAAATGAAAADGRLEVAIARRGHGRDGWSARLSVHDAAGGFVGAREIDRASASCHALDSALVLVAALLVDTLRAQEAQAAANEALRPHPPPAPRDETPIPMDAEPAAALAVSSAPARPVVLDNGLGATFAGGAMPHPAFGVAGLTRLSSGRWLAGELAGSWLPHTVLGDRPGGTFDGGWLTLGYCPTLLGAGDLSLTGCARGGVAVTHATGSGVDVSESSTLVYGVLGVAARGRITLVGPLGASLELAGYLPVDRPEFFVRSGTTHRDVYSATSVFGAVSAFLEVRGL